MQKAWELILKIQTGPYLWPFFYRAFFLPPALQAAGPISFVGIAVRI